MVVHYIFVSYAREDEAIAAQLVADLRARDVNVWWDKDLTGERFGPEIKRKISAASGVIGLASRTAVRKDFVIDEWRAAHARDCLILARLDDVTYDNLPLGLQGLNVIDLGARVGNAESNGFQKVLQCCWRFVGRAEQQKSAAAQPGSTVEPRATEPAKDRRQTKKTVHIQGPLGQYIEKNQGTLTIVMDLRSENQRKDSKSERKQRID